MTMDWFRSHHGAPTDPKWRTIAKRAGVAPGVVVSLAWAMLDAASQATDRGSVASVDAETLADFMGYEVEVVERVMAAMGDKGVLAGERFTAWERRQPKKEDDSAAERKRLQRERERSEREEAKRAGGTQPDLPLVPPGHEVSRAVTTEQSREDQSRTEPGKPGHAGPPACEAEPGRADDLRSLEFQCRDALAGVDPPKGSFAPIALLVERGADPVEVATVLRAEASKPRKTPIASWPGWAKVIEGRLAASTPTAAPQARASPPPPDDGPRVNTPSGPRSVAFLLAQHRANRWSTMFGKPPGHPDCPIADHLPRPFPDPTMRAAE